MRIPRRSGKTRPGDSRPFPRTPATGPIEALRKQRALHLRAQPHLRRVFSPLYAPASSGFTRNHAAYSAGRNSSVSPVATTSPPMIATAMEP